MIVKERMRVNLRVTRLNILPMLWGKLAAWVPKCTRGTMVGHPWREGSIIGKGIMEGSMVLVTFPNRGEYYKKNWWENRPMHM